jgi:hypothetical protein
MSFLDDMLSPIFGSKPKVPALEELSLSEEQLKAIEANLAAEPEARRLSDLTADQIESLMRRTTPNFDSLTTGISGTIEDFSRGRIPKDVSELVMRSDAAKALAGGFAGTGMHAALTARDLGLTSLDLIGKGISAAQSWLQSSQSLYAPAMATYQSMFITPTQQAAFSVEERNTQFQRSWMKEQIKAMPDPVMRGLHDTIMSLAVAYLGGNYQSQNPQQNYAQAGSGVTGPRYGAASYEPGGWNEYQGFDWSNPSNYGGGPAAAGGAGVGGAEAAAGAMGGGGMGAAMGFMCWVARECYGVTNPRWMIFRQWMIFFAPWWFFNLYLKHGERFARWLKNKPRLKSVIRRWMDSKIKIVEGR